MIFYEESFNKEKLRYLRQYFFEQKRLLFLDGMLDNFGGHAYQNDPTMPGWATSPRACIDQILYLDFKNHEEPIRLIIDSRGGSLGAYLSLYDVMRSVKAPIYTAALGLVASAAVPILIAGETGHRSIFKTSRTMIHLGESGSEGTRAQQRSRLKAFDDIEGRYIAILSDHTGRSKEEIQEGMEEERWMNAEESKAFGMVDNIIANKGDIAL